MQVVFVTAREVLQRQDRGTQSRVNRDGVAEAFGIRDMARHLCRRRRDAIR